MTQQQYAV